MAANFTELQIVNKALLRLSANQVESIDSTVAGITTDSLEAKLCKLNYDIVRDIVLEDRVWSFALKRVILDTPSSTVPAFEYSTAFTVPTDALNIWRVMDQPCGESYDVYQAPKWILEGNLIMVNLEKIYVQYVKRLDSAEIQTATPQFVDSLSLRLALEMCMPLTENNQLFEGLRAEYEYRLVNASGIDGSQATHETFQSNKLTGVRNGVGYWIGSRT